MLRFAMRETSTALTTRNALKALFDNETEERKKNQFVLVLVEKTKLFFISLNFYLGQRAESERAPENETSRLSKNY